MANRDYVLSATLELRDKLTGKLNDARKGLEGVKGSAAAASGALDRVGTSAVKAAADTGRLKSALSGVKGSYQTTVGVKDEASSKLGAIMSSVRELAGRASAFTVRARDEASGKLTRIKEELAGLTGKTYTAMVNVKQNGGISKLKEGMSGFAGGMLMGLPLQVAGMAGLGYGVMDTINTYKNFEKQMATVKAIATSGMGVNEANAAMERMTAKAREMGAVTQFTAEQVGKAFEYMAMAGWKEQQMMAGIKPVLDLALAAGEDLGRVSDIVTDSMTALKIDTRGANANANIKDFADILAATATNSNTTVGMMGEAFKYAAAPAGLFASAYGSDEVGVAKDVALALGLMADSGIKASMAGTALRSTLTRMTADTIPAANAMKMLGINIMQMGADGTQQLKPLRAIFDDLRKKFKEGVSAEELVNYAETLSGTKTRNKEKMVTFAQQLAAQGGKMNDKDKAKFAKMFAGEEAISGWLAIITASDEDYQRKIAAIDNSRGAADEMSKKRADTLAGDLEILKSAWQDFQIELMSGKGASGLRDFVQGLSKDVTQFKTSLKDGLDIGDIGSLALNVLKQLKDKFIQFDGVGSILAGGALAAGLYKIVGLTRKAVDAVKGLAGMRKGGAILGKSGASSVGEMVVNAATVIVNGKSIAGGGAGPGKNSGGVIFGPDGRPIQSGGRTQAPTPQPGRAAVLRANAKALGGAGALAAIFGAMDVYSTHSQNSTLMEEAVWGVKQASENIEELTKNGGSQEQWRSALDEYTKANDYRAQVEHDNRMREGDAIGGALGSTIGTVLGGAIGSFAGPAGTVIGMTAGGILGEIAGKRIGSWLADYNIQNTVTFEKIAQWLNPKEKGPIGFDLNGKTVPVDIVGDSVGIKDTSKDTSGPFGLQTDLSAIGPHAFDTPRDTSQDFGITEMQNMYTTGMFSGVQEEAQEAASASADAFSEASASISTDFENTGAQATATADNIQMDMLGSAQGSQDTWSSFPSWYDASVAVPTSDAASDCGEDVSDSFETSASDTQDAWGGVGGFFSRLFDSIKSGATNCAASVAQSMASAAASAREGDHTNVAAVLDFGTQVFDWVAGTNYSGKHWASGTSFAPGGWSEINEHGGEIVDLPTGARVYPHATTLSMLKHTFEDNLPTAIPVSAPSVSVDLPRARSDAEATQVVITGNSFAVREEADIDKIAYKLLTLMQQAKANMNPVEGVFA